MKPNFSYVFNRRRQYLPNRSSLNYAPRHHPYRRRYRRALRHGGVYRTRSLWKMATVDNRYL